MTSVGIVASGFYQSVAPPVLPVTTGLVWWLDADDAASFDYQSTPPAVYQWSDKSVSAFHAFQTVSANRPNRVTNAQNARAGVTFGISPVQSMKTTTPVTGTITITWFVCAKRTGGGVGTEPNVQSVVVHNGIPNSNGLGIAMRANSLNIGLLKAAILMESTATACPAVAGVISFQRDVGTSSMWLNGAATSLTYSASANAASAYTIVPSDVHLFAGDVYEVLAYNRMLSTGERQAVEGYLKSKWGTP